MSKYEGLDARTELEQTLTADLKGALEKRGLTVTHNGTSTANAPGNIPDIVMESDEYTITVEATKTRRSAQDREFNAIKDHLQSIKNENPSKKCFCIYASPETPNRMVGSISEYNLLRKNEPDMKIMPLNFDTIELIIKRLTESVRDQFPLADLIKLFSMHSEFADDQRIKKIVQQNLFPEDSDLSEDILREEIEKDQKTLESLVNGLDKLENYLREHGIATGERAIDTLIYIVFTELYEEKRVKDGKGKNRLKMENFIEYRDNQPRDVRESKMAIHALFDTIKSEEEFVMSGMFTASDNFTDNLNDDFVTEKIIPFFMGYPSFVGTKVDALGAVYEVLALRANKDVKVGQFFTPESVVRFMVKLAELDFKDVVLDPACGTGRFLIWSMDDMLKKVDSSRERDKAGWRDKVSKANLLGTDIDGRIAKIAKMNMWIHGDGKTNIVRHNGLLLDHSPYTGRSDFDDTIDVVLTNPPLGDLNYQSGYTDAFRQRMEVLPLKNATEEKLTEIKEKLDEYGSELTDLEKHKTELESDADVQAYISTSAGKRTKAAAASLRSLKGKEPIKEYCKALKAIESKKRIISSNEAKRDEFKAKIYAGDIEFTVTGNTMKGGALFINAIEKFLKGERDPEALPEWRGGKLITIIDEGVLNTDDYASTRAFIRKHFYIKAVISLTRDTFVPVSKTTTKTSVLYLIKKEDIDAVQQEPIFFAHAELVGMDTKKKVCANHLDPILAKYLAFKDAVLTSYDELVFNKRKFIAKGISKGPIE